MSNRRKSRECAVQILYQMDSQEKNQNPESITSAIDHFFIHFESKPDIYNLTSQLVLGTLKHLEAIDALISKHSPNWKINRMATVDRNIARLAAYELLHLPEVPTSVILDEAIEIAKRFGTERSSQFINGLLDPIAHEIRQVKTSQ